MSEKTIFVKRMARKIKDEDLEKISGGYIHGGGSVRPGTCAAGGGVDYSDDDAPWLY